MPRCFESSRNRNGGDLQKLRSRAFAIKAGDLTLLLVAEKSPWEASRNAWLLGCAELLGGMTVPNQTTRLSEQPQQQGDPSEQPSHQAYDQPVEPHLNEGQESIADEPDHTEEQEQIPGQEQQDAAVTAWYEEVGNVLWCQYSVEDVQEADGQPLVEFEDLLSGAVLDLTQHDKPEHYWYWLVPTIYTLMRLLACMCPSCLDHSRLHTPLVDNAASAVHVSHYPGYVFSDSSFPLVVARAGMKKRAPILQPTPRREFR